MEIKVHEITKKFPLDEIYRSVDQLRRSSASVSNNIAESYHKKSFKEKDRYLSIAKGEMEETKRNVLKSARKGFLPEIEAKTIAEQYTILLKGTNSYIRFLKLNEKPKPEKPGNKNR